MDYDLEIIVPVCKKYYERLEDFKKYGLINIKNKKVLLTLIVSGEDLQDVEKGWHNIEVKKVFSENKNYAANLFNYFLNIDVKSRWIMKIDDDSCTDINDLLDNLDNFYDYNSCSYLATSIAQFIQASPEAHLRNLYEKFLGKKYAKMQHEIECSILSSNALKKILTNEISVDFLKERCTFEGGATDVALAYASVLSKIHPVNFPFATHLPLINEFSLFGGDFNHIHMISRNPYGDNFVEWQRCGDVQYEALVRKIDDKMTEIESQIAEKKFLMETENELLSFYFANDRSLKIKFDNRNLIWIEHDGFIKVFFDPKQVYMSLKLDNSGNLFGKNIEGKEYHLRRLNF